jgi:hypothetical protein
MASRDKKLKLEKLAELKRAREGGKRVWKVEFKRILSFDRPANSDFRIGRGS